MEIKKTKSGWEYDGITFVDEASAEAAKKANEETSSEIIPEEIGEEIRTIYDGDRPTSFGLFMTAYLREDGRSIVQLAKDIGISKQALFDWMNAKSVPSRKHVERIIVVTGCRLSVLKEALEDNFAAQKEKLFENLKEA